MLLEVTEFPEGQSKYLMQCASLRGFGKDFGSHPLGQLRFHGQGVTEEFPQEIQGQRAVQTNILSHSNSDAVA